MLSGSKISQTTKKNKPLTLIEGDTFLSMLNYTVTTTKLFPILVTVRVLSFKDQLISHY